jgi:hypothetical protein
VSLHDPILLIGDSDFEHIFSIVGIVLAADPLMSIGRNEFGVDNLRLMSQLGEFACPVVCARARLHGDSARRQLCEERQHLAAFQGALQAAMLIRIDAVDN